MIPSGNPQRNKKGHPFLGGLVCVVDSVRKLVLDLAADSFLQVQCLVSAQAGVDCLVHGQLEVVHRLAPFRVGFD